MVFPAASSPTSTSAAHPPQTAATSDCTQTTLARGPLWGETLIVVDEHAVLGLRRRGHMRCVPRAISWIQEITIWLNLTFPALFTADQRQGWCRTMRFRREQVEDPAAVPEAQAPHPQPPTALDVLPSC